MTGKENRFQAKGPGTYHSGIRVRMKRTSAKRGKEGRKWNDVEMTGGKGMGSREKS